MAEDTTRIPAVEPDEIGLHTDLALVVAALGGGPGDRIDSGVRRGAARPPAGGGLATILAFLPGGSGQPSRNA